MAAPVNEHTAPAAGAVAGTLAGGGAAVGRGGGGGGGRAELAQAEDDRVDHDRLVDAVRADRKVLEHNLAGGDAAHTRLFLRRPPAATRRRRPPAGRLAVRRRPGA